MQHGHMNVKNIMRVLQVSANCHFEIPVLLDVRCAAQYYSEGQSELISLFIRKCYWWSNSLIFSVFVFDFWVYLWLEAYFRVQNSPPPTYTYTFNMIINYNVHNIGGCVLITNNVYIICGWGGHKKSTSQLNNAYIIYNIW
jgi:hypothetical protein